MREAALKTPSAAETYCECFAAKIAKKELKASIEFTNRGGQASSSQRGSIEEAQVPSHVCVLSATLEDSLFLPLLCAQNL